MLRSPRSRWRSVAFTILAGAALIVVALSLSCNDPQAPPPSSSASGDYRGSYGSGGIEFTLEVPGDPSRLKLVASGLVYDAATQELHVQVAIRNAGNQPVPGPDRVLLSRFDPAGVSPTNMMQLECPRCPGCECWPSWVVEYIGQYGDDGSLDPGETSQAVEWIIQDPSGQSFSFRAQIQPGSTPAAGTIAGRVFVDANNDGVSQEDEAGVSGVTIHLSNDATSQETTTGDHGAFQFTVPREGFYEVAADPTPECPQLPAFRIVSIVRDDDGTLSGYGHADFACRGGVLPPLPSITGLVFDDRNSNGVADPLELGIAGVAIEISGQRCNAPVLVLHTDEHGRYVVFSEEMPCLPPWQLRRERLDGRCDTTPNPTILRGWPIRQPPMPIVIDFGSAPCDPVPTEPSVEGTVFVDLDRDGVRDPGEAGIAGVTLTILSPCDAVWEAHTDPRGHYVFANIGCQILGVQIVQPDFPLHTTPNPFLFPAGTTPGTVDFGVARGR